MKEKLQNSKLGHFWSKPEKRKKILQHFLVFFVVLLLSILIELFGFNFKFWTLNEEARGIHNLNYTTSQNQEETVIKLNQDNDYINKLLVHHTTGDKTTVRIKYIYQGAYQQNIIDEKERVFEPLIPITVINLDRNISQIEISYPKTAKTNVTSIESKNTLNFNYLRFTFILSAFILIYLLYCFWKNGFKTEKLHLYFIPIALILGGLFIWLQPAATFYSLDDQIHFENTVNLFKQSDQYSDAEYHMSNSNLSGTIGGDKNITSIEEREEQSDYLNSNTGTTKIENNDLVSWYSKIAYIPMSIGYHTAKFLHLPFTMCFRIAKFCNLLVYVILIAYAIKITKVGKRILLFIALLPVNIFLASSFSYDPIVFIGITLFVVSLINFFVDKNYKATPKHLLVMLLPMVVACCVKAIYAPLILLTLLIPAVRFKNKKQSYWIKFGFILLCLILLSTFMLPLITQTTPSDPRGGDTSVFRQLSLILHHPIDYSSILWENAGTQLLSSFIGPSITTLAYLGGCPATSNLYLILIIVLVFLALTDNRHNNLKGKYRILCLVMVLLLVIAIWSALYLSFTPVGYTMINGVQPRYFLPFIFLIIVCLQPKCIQCKINPKLYNLLTLGIPILITLIMLVQFLLIPLCL